jgi:hypothetical protein
MSHRLQQALHEVQERNEDILYDLVSVQKMDYQAAWEMVTRQWAFSPTRDRPPSSGNSTPQTRFLYNLR